VRTWSSKQKHHVNVTHVFLLFELGNIREMVKTIVLRQDPPFRKKTGGLFMCPLPPP